MLNPYKKLKLNDNKLSIAFLSIFILNLSSKFNRTSNPGIVTIIFGLVSKSFLLLFVYFMIVSFQYLNNNSLNTI